MERNTVVKSALRKLIHADSDELIKRYISKCVKPKNIQKTVEDVLAMVDEVGNAKFGAIATFSNDLPEGKYGSASTNYIYNNIFVTASRILSVKGYELNVENMMSDLDDIFQDYALLVLNAHDKPEEVPQFVKDVVFVYYTNVLKDKVLNKVLGDSLSV